MKAKILTLTILVLTWVGVYSAVPRHALPVLESPYVEVDSEKAEYSPVIRQKRQNRPNDQDNAEGGEDSLDVPPISPSEGSLDFPTPPPLPQEVPTEPSTPAPTTEPVEARQEPLQTTSSPSSPPSISPSSASPRFQSGILGGRQMNDEQNVTDLCDFGTLPDVALCEWSNLNVTLLKWIPSAGQSAFWIGGPQEDVTYGDAIGGYAVFETSNVPSRAPGTPAFGSAMLMSPVRETTGANGMCVKFWYSIAGLSPDRIRVLLHPMPDDMKNGDSVDDLMLGYDGSEDVVLWEARDMTMGDWKEGQIVYTFNKNHSGIPVDSNDLSRRFRGFIAVDELVFTESSQCGAFCTFEGGTCGWAQDTNDDFNWVQSRGSLNPSTGPPRDRSSFANNGMMGGYAYIDTGYPRTPGDRARLMSQEFQGTNPDSPLCMRFWTHMYGSGIGSLRVILYDVNAKEDNVIWSITGEAGNAWYQGQVPIASPKPFKVSPNSFELPSFKIVFEGEVGNNNLGDIAIDDISIVQGACPSAPQVAAGNNGDCTFEVDECGWINPGPRERFDEMDWVRTIAADNRAPSRDHTIGTSQGFYMSLPRGSVQRGGDRAWFVSAIMDGKPEATCIAFWYFMYEPFIDPAGPSLGSLMLYLLVDSTEPDRSLIPVWSLKNHQGPNWQYGQAKVQSDKDFQLAFEGTWGSSRGNGFMALDDITIFAGDCSTLPVKATTMSSDCDFQRDACQWRNETTDRDFRWTTASISRRPANLPDHTFSGPIGYAYFDVFNQNAEAQSLTLMSPPIKKSPNNAPMCLSFWFAYFGASETTKLKVQRQPYDKNLEEDKQVAATSELWTLDALAIGTQRPEWQFGQIQISTNTDFRILLVGMASNGGFAIDDLKTYTGTCGTRPRSAAPGFVRGGGKETGGTTDEEEPEDLDTPI